jgi:hypothetical protein
MVSLSTIQTPAVVDSSPEVAREEKVESVADAADTTTTTTETERATSSVVVDVAAEAEAKEKVRGLRQPRETRHQCRKTKRRRPLSRNEGLAAPEKGKQAYRPQHLNKKNKVNSEIH